MKDQRQRFKTICNNRGAVAIIVGIMMAVFLGFAAFAIDIGHIVVVRNELQNAADAGALAGARVLYNDEGTSINPNTAQTAFEIATANQSEDAAVEVLLEEGDVQIGHWCFTCNGGVGEFREISDPSVTDLVGVSSMDLDANFDFVNAVQVITRRDAIPANTFFAGILGHNNFRMTAKAVAYRGFAGTLAPGEAAQPIAICEEDLLNADGEYICNVGTMINSGEASSMQETGAWTSFEQGEGVCSGGTNDREVRGLVCGDGNNYPLLLGNNIATTNGQLQNSHSNMRDCWNDQADTNSDGVADQMWNMTLPVIQCGENPITTCARVVGAVNVNVVWISGAGSSTCQYPNMPPLNMDDWSCPIQNPQSQADFDACWDSFVGHFNLLNYDGGPAPCQMKTIYFKPDCEPQVPRGTTGGNNYGILAQIPVLVQ